MSVFSSSNWLIYECIDNSGMEHKLTIGEEYYGSEMILENGRKIVMVREDDMGNLSIFDAHRFLES